MCSICGAPSKEYLCNKCTKKLENIEMISRKYTFKELKSIEKVEIVKNIEKVQEKNKNIKRIEFDKENKKEENIQEKFYFDEHIYEFIYEGEIRNLILQYKFNSKPYIYKTFTNFFKKNKNLYLHLKKYDIIMPIPISKKRLQTRGYNQSSLIAESLAKSFNIKYEEKLLIKYKNNKRQSTLSKEERLLNAKNVYELRIGTNLKQKIKNKKILLFDDVFTTGSTCNECSRILKENGARQVGIFTIAKD